MAITVDRALRQQLRRPRGGITILVTTQSPVESVRNALNDARPDILRLADTTGGDTLTPSYVSTPTPTNTGAFITIDTGDMHASALTSVPEIITRHLRATGITDARIETPTDDPRHLFWQPPHRGREVREGASYAPNAVRLSLFAPRPPIRGFQPRLPDHWFTIASEWLIHNNPSDVSVALPELQRWPAEDLPQLLKSTWEAAGTLNARLATGDLNATLRIVGLSSHLGMLSLATAGPALTNLDRLGAFDALIQIARQAGPNLCHATISFHDSAGYMTGFPRSQWGTRTQRTGRKTLKYIIDETLLGVFPYQILSEGHITRLDGPPPGAQQLTDTHWELFIGTPDQWLGPDREQVERDGEEILRPCLIETAELRRLQSARPLATDDDDYGRIWPDE